MNYRQLLPSTLLLCSLCSIHAAAQPGSDPASNGPPMQTVKGTVRSSGTQQPIVGASVAILGTKRGAITKEDGSFTITNVPVGRHTVRVQSIGHEPMTMQILLTSGRQSVLEIELQESVVTTEEITVTADPFKPINETALVSAQSFSVEEVQRYAGGFDDPGRIAQNFAGVTGTDDKFNDIVIRGGSPAELLWRLDGMDIPNPNHFGSQGASGGPINAINNNLLSNSDFFTGAFPAEYGTRLSGVFDLRTRKGNQDEYEFVGQVGFNGIEAMAEGPIPGIERGSFILDYRKSLLEVFDIIGVSLGVGAVVPKYQDATAKIDLPIGPDDHIAVTALGGISNADEDPSEFAHTGDRLFREGTDLGAAGITWTSLLSTKAVGQLTLSTQYNRFRNADDSLTVTDGRVVDRTTWWERRAVEGAHVLRYRLSYAPVAAHQITAGAEGRRIYYDLLVQFPTRGGEANFAPSITSEGAWHGAGFLNWNWRPIEEIAVNAGVYTQYLGLNSTLSIEPRLGASWSFTPLQSINLGIGVHRQMQPLVLYYGNPENRELDFTQSIHYILGYTNRLASDLLAKGELYYKDIAHAPVTRDGTDPFSMLNAGHDFTASDITFPLENSGRGRVYGLELSLLKNFTDGYYITATGSLFRQEYTGSDQVWRYGVFDNRFVVNLLAGYEWKVSPSFTMEMSARFTIAGGRRHTPIDLDSSRLAGWTVFDRSQPYGAVYPHYSRLDTRIDFRNNFDGWALISYVSMLNTLARENILNYRYNPRTGGIDYSTQLGLIPVGGIRVEF